MSIDEDLREDLERLTVRLVRVEGAANQRIAELEERLYNEVRSLQDDVHRLKQELSSRAGGYGGTGGVLPRVEPLQR